MLALLSVFVLLGLLSAVYGWFEAGWLRKRVVDVHVPGLPPSLNGLRIGHLSDLHLGAALSRGNQASVRAAEWVAARGLDLVCVTGDLVSHPRGERRLRALLDLLEHPYVVLGNHDIAVSRDPFSRTAELRDLEAATLLRDEATTIIVRGERVSVVGIDPETYRQGTRPDRLIYADGAFRMLLCHFPAIVRRLPARSFDLILAGHLHAGQICVPFLGRKLTLAHPRAAFVGGVYETAAGMMHVSPGTGTTSSRSASSPGPR